MRERFCEDTILCAGLINKKDLIGSKLDTGINWMFKLIKTKITGNWD